MRLHDASNVGSNVGSKRLGQCGANAGANVGDAGYRLHDASNSPILEATFGSSHSLHSSIGSIL